MLLLLRALEVETPDIAARGRFVVADSQNVEAARDFFPNCFLVVQRVARLIDVGQFDRRADANFAAIGFFIAGQHAE